MITTLLRKPLDGSVADNTLKHGCGSLNIDNTRIGTEARSYKGSGKSNQVYTESRAGMSDGRGKDMEFKVEGRWPANFCLIHKEICCPVRELDKQSGFSKSPSSYFRKSGNVGKGSYGGNIGQEDGELSKNFGDSGGASRFFKQFKKDIEMEEMIEYFKTMITPPVEDACVVVSTPDDLDFSAYKKEVFEEGALIPITEPMVHGIILLGEPTEELSKQIMGILKPGAHVVMIPEGIGYKGVIALEDCGFEVRDAIFVAEEPNTFQYRSKASRSEREAGLPTKDEGRANPHPTVKPIEIMEWCARDITPNSKVVDPFLGSGTTGIAMSRLGHDFVGVELNPEYAKICEGRIRHWMPIGTEIKSEAQVGKEEPKKGEQISIFDLFG